MSDVPMSEAATARQQRLATAVAGMKVRSQFDMQRALLFAGSILLPTGLIVILLGWLGAAHTSYDFEQTPYLISGGLFGAGLTIAGGFLYFGYWLTRIVQEGQRQRTELAALLQRLDNRMAIFEAVAAGNLPSTAMSGNGAGAPPAGLVATATGTLVHRSDCSLVKGKSGLRVVSAGEDLRPCKVCQPFATEETGVGVPVR